MNELVGKWTQIAGQPYEGLWFHFFPDGKFQAEYEPMSIVSSGTYEAAEGEVRMQQTSHTLGLIGEFKGLYLIEENNLKLALASGAGQARPENLKEARLYQKS